jgi:hypothetical protein
LLLSEQGPLPTGVNIAQIPQVLQKFLLSVGPFALQRKPDLFSLIFSNL